MGIYDYPDPPREPPPLQCSRCHGDMSDEVYIIDGAPTCEDCFDDYIKELTRGQLADALFIGHLTKDAYLENIRNI